MYILYIMQTAVAHTVVTSRSRPTPKSHFRIKSLTMTNNNTKWNNGYIILLLGGGGINAFNLTDIGFL